MPDVQREPVRGELGEYLCEQYDARRLVQISDIAGDLLICLDVSLEDVDSEDARTVKIVHSQRKNWRHVEPLGGSAAAS